MTQELLNQYARLIVQMGVNVEKSQTVVIGADIGNADLVERIAEQAYEQGAKEVVVNWTNEKLLRLKYEKGGESVFDEFPQWRKVMFEDYDRDGACYISLVSANPDLLRGIPSDRIQRSMVAQSKALAVHMKATMESRNCWTVVAAPSVEWAQKVYPGLSEGEAVERLWKAIAKAARFDTPDPLQAWENQNATFEKRIKYLNEKRFRSLHYVNRLGTDLRVELPEGHIWSGGAEVSTGGRRFFPNMPTEEIFTLPHRNGVNGRVVSAMPLCYQGVTIEDFELTFENGRAVHCKAGKNQDALENILNMDEGARRLGEVALVPYSSPISDMKTLFYNTLYDENASCHFALGKAYPTCLEGFSQMSAEALLEAGVNESLTHVDFMVGTDDLEITGTDADGNISAVFIKGNFAF